MKIDLYAEGAAFTSRGLNLDETLHALASFSSTFKNCLEIAADSKLNRNCPKPVLKINYVKPGSLDAQFLIDMSGALASLMPLVPDYAYKMICSASWDLFTKTLKASIALAKYFSENKTPITYNVNVLPGGVANFGQSGGVMNVSSALDESIRKSYKDIANLADLFNKKSISHIKTTTDFIDETNPTLSREFDFSDNDGKYFTIQEIETHDSDPIDIPCRIFSINRKSKNGRLDYFDEVVGPKPIPFSVKEGNINDYIDAMKKDTAIVTATRSFLINALGERKVSHLSLLGVTFP